MNFLNRYYCRCIEHHPDSMPIYHHLYCLDTTVVMLELSAFYAYACGLKLYKKIQFVSVCLFMFLKIVEPYDQKTKSISSNGKFTNSYNCNFFLIFIFSVRVKIIYIPIHKY